MAKFTPETKARHRKKTTRDQSKSKHKHIYKLTKDTTNMRAITEVGINERCIVCDRETYHDYESCHLINTYWYFLPYKVKFIDGVYNAKTINFETQEKGWRDLKEGEYNEYMVAYELERKLAYEKRMEVKWRWLNR